MKHKPFSLTSALGLLILAVIVLPSPESSARPMNVPPSAAPQQSDVIADKHFSDMVGALAPQISGAQKIIVIRAVASDDAGITTRYTQAQVQTLFDSQLNTLWKNTSYNTISINATATSLVTLPQNRSAYLGSGGSSLGNLNLALNDAIAAASGLGLDYTGVKAVMVLMGLPAGSFFFRGVENTIMLPIGAGGSLVASPAALFAENRTEAEPYVWGRWAHEIGHAFQSGGPAHPSNYNNEFELMDDLYPGQTGMFEKYIPTGFPGWMPAGKYTVIPITPPGTQCGGTVFIAAEELSPGAVVAQQALVAQLSAGLYYMVSVRKKMNGDELYPIPDEGVLIERVVVGADPWVTVQGKGGNRDVLWKDGDTFSSPENIQFIIASTVDPNVYRVTVRCQNTGQPDAFLTPWLTPPLNTYETTDIWIDSNCNGFGTFQYGTYIPSGDSTPVGNGNGDNPCSNHVNRVYARIRNIGTQPANNVVVNFEVTDPLGVGVAGASGWAAIGTATSATFPGLTSIPVGGYTDVYVNWTPSIASPPTGDFDFHSCIRVRINQVTSPSTEFTTANNMAQENVAQFYSPPASGGAGAPINQVIHLINDSSIVTKTYSLFWTHDLPPDWTLDVNSNQTEIVLPPSGVRDLPVKVIPNGVRTAGQVFHIHVAANYSRLLVNTLNGTDHVENPLLGGVNFQIRIADPSRLSIQPSRSRDGVRVKGQVTPADPQGRGRNVMVDLLDGMGRIFISQLATTDGMGNFDEFFQGNAAAIYAAANFMGEQDLAGSFDHRLIEPAYLFLPLILR